MSMNMNPPLNWRIGNLRYGSNSDYKVELHTYESNLECEKDYKNKEDIMKERSITVFIPVDLYEESAEFRFMNRKKYKSYKQFVKEAIKEKLEREK